MTITPDTTPPKRTKRYAARTFLRSLAVIIFSLSLLISQELEIVYQLPENGARVSLESKALQHELPKRLRAIVGAEKTSLAANAVRSLPTPQRVTPRIKAILERVRKLRLTAEKNEHQALITELVSLKARGVIEDFSITSAAPAPPPGDIAPLTPSYAAQQDSYAGNQYATSTRVRELHALNHKGLGVRLCDVEYDFNAAHEDLEDRQITTTRSTWNSPFGSDHGSAVIGLIGAPENGYGIDGIAPAAELAFSPTYADSNVRIDEAILAAIDILEPGDVILMETQTSVTEWDYQEVLYPSEVSLSVYNAVRAAIDAGIIVVSAAGNGYHNLDLGTGVAGENWRARPDSGAILVGAGDYNGNRMSYSNHGTRVNVQAHGDWSVTTLGYGDLSDFGVNQTYTRDFAGTSSASAIIAGCVATLQSAALVEQGEPLSPGEIRELLITTGNSALPDVGEIGPSIDCVAALEVISASQSNQPPVPISGGTRTIADSDGLPGELVTLDGSASYDPDGTITRHAWWIERPGEGWVRVGDDAIMTTTLIDGDNPIRLKVFDDDEEYAVLSFVITVTAPSNGGPLPADSYLISDFTGTAPGLNTPWLATAALGEGLSTAGWTLPDESEIYGADTDDAFGVYVKAGSTPSTLAEALASRQYLSLHLTAETGYTLDLAGEEIECGFKRWSTLHAPQRFVVMSSVDGFSAATILHDLSTSEPRQSLIDTLFTLPADERFNHLSDFELRIYLVDALYFGKTVSLEHFRLGNDDDTNDEPPPADAYLISDFTGTAPGLNTPWLTTAALGEGLSTAGWTLPDESEIYGADTDDAFGVYVKAGSTPSTLAEALASHQYLSLHLTAETGYTLDLAGEEIECGFKRWSTLHAPQRFVVMSSVDGFSAATILHDLSTSEPRQSLIDTLFTLPADERFNHLSDFELRIYLVDALYFGKTVSLEHFRLGINDSTN